MEPSLIALQKGRRPNVEMLEERIAPAHVRVVVPDQALAVQNEQSPHLVFKAVQEGGSKLGRSNPNETPATNPSND